MDESPVKLIKPFYRPSVEREKRRYWELKNQQRRIAARRAKLPSAPTKKPIPDNSVPWLDHPARSFAEIFYISDQIEAEILKCRPI